MSYVPEGEEYGIAKDFNKRTDVHVCSSAIEDGPRRASAGDDARVS
jgi:hypothetical protein